jgi:energy-converting hydrogenase Eha subunit A
MHAPASTLVPLLIAVPFLAWRLYSRARRSIGRQPLSKSRPWITLAVFPTLIILLGIAALAHPESLGWLAAGVCAGAALGIFGLRKTTFENTPQGLFYTPNARIGIALSALLVARVIYRMFQVYSTDPSAQLATPDFARSPLTLALFGLLAGYYITYAIELVRWRRRESR